MATSLPVTPVQQQTPRGVSPWWHTALLVLFMLVFSALGAGGHPGLNHSLRMKLYISTIVMEWLMVLYIWWGLRLAKQTSISDLIGGRWKKPEDFLLDVAIALGFWIVAGLVLAAIGLALGLNSTAHLKDMQQRIGSILPETRNEILTWILLSTTAGFCEEVIYRGYLQRQFTSVLKSSMAGIAVQALIFGASHGYEGWQTMVQITAFGALFGALAYWRKSLRPGMIAHFTHDTVQGLASRWILENASKALPK